MNPIKVILLLALFTLALAAIGPGFTQKFANQEKDDVRNAIIANSARVDPRPACAGVYGNDLKKLAAQHKLC